MQRAQHIAPTAFRPSPPGTDTASPAVHRFRPLLQAALATDSSKTLLFQRLVLAGVVFPHGLQKVFGWFGGFGLDATLGWFQSALGVPAAVTWLVIAADFLGPIALALGLFSRLSALGVTLTMLGAVALVHAPNGFLMNWGGTNPGEGYEFHLLALALSIPLLVRGGGAAAVDSWLTRRLSAGDEAPRGAET